MTPFPALNPYKAAAFGPFKTEIDSISSGLRSEAPFGRSTPPPEPASPKLRLLIGTPSTTYSGSLLPVIEELPLNTILEEAPTLPESQ